MSCSEVASTPLARNSASVNPVNSAEEDDSPAAGRQIRDDRRVDPVLQLPAAFDRLGGRFYVVHPIAGGRRLELRRPLEFPLAERVGA